MSIFYTILITYIILAISASFLVFPALMLSGQISRREDLYFDTLEFNKNEVMLAR